MEVLRAGKERAVLVGVSRPARLARGEEDSLTELAELARSAGAEVVAAFHQERAQLDPGYLVGRGKLEEVRAAVVHEQVDVVIFDEELTPAQLRNLEAFLETKVIDRSELILDIFAQRARSREGKLQVELAQLEYLLPRLTGRGRFLSRLGGGIGTRGPGETKLEVDRRTIRSRLARIRRELEKLEERRALQRQKRQGIPIPTVSLVGYTNAGKSTLFNALTGDATYVSARMFATLDPLVRKVELESGQEILLSDTVGFVRKLPHSLVAAFHATLEETLEADLVLHVIDVSHPRFRELRRTVYQVLDEIGFGGAPILEAYNKLDRVSLLPHLETPYPWVAISARTGEGVEALRKELEELVSRNYRKVSLTIPFDRGEIVARLRERARVDSEEYRADGIHLQASLPLADLGRYREFVDPPSSQ